MVKPHSKNWGLLFASLLAACVGVMAIITREVGSATVREIHASGDVARCVGALLLIVAAMLFVEWVRKLRQHP